LLTKTKKRSENKKYNGQLEDSNHECVFFMCQVYHHTLVTKSFKKSIGMKDFTHMYKKSEI
jgi:hypothetical protein